jgi:hypothetical protein
VDDTVDNVRYLHAASAAGPVAPRGPHRGTDRSGAVQVEIDDTARDARLSLAGGWRDRIGVARLGEAVVQAVEQAVAARAAAWAAGSPAVADPPSLTDRPPGSPPEVIAGAWRDLREFQVRLAQLHDTAVTVTGSAGRVAVTVRGGCLVGVAPDPSWATGARDADLADRLGEALRAGLTAIDDLPGRALGGSPLLRGRLPGQP